MANVHASSRFFSARLALIAALAGFAMVAMQGDGRACGGLFCNARPPDPFAPLPVAQNGENVVFAITKDPAGGAPTLAAHIQILYTGDAAKFSWVVPVEAVPVLSTGTDRLFSALAGVTQPSYRASYETSGTCIQQPFMGADAGAFQPPFATGSAGTTGAGGSGAAGVNVLFQGAVGPFGAAIIQSTDPVALKMWLSDNGYVVSDAAGALIDTYVREKKYFVALKLLNGVGVRSIQPIVLTFRGTEPCVPLRLTAIAANPDMPVLVWVLSDKRVVPRGFLELKIDEARIDWWSAGSSYFGPRGLVSQAANEAGGNAFIAEYAGPSTVARSSVYTNGQINLTMLRTAMIPPVYVQQLLAMGLANDTLMLPLLAKYIPMPAAVKAMNVTDSQFYGNLQFYWNQFAFPPYDLAGLTDAIDMSIVMPRLNAQTMIDGHTYLTRLNTFLSPEEMNQDAFFFENKDLPDLSNVHTAVIRTLCGNMAYMACNAPIRLELTDGRMIWMRAGSKGTTCDAKTPDVVPLAKLPAVATAWKRENVGEGMPVVDNTPMIKAGIKANNQKYVAEEMLFPTPTSMTGAAGAPGTGGTGPGAGGAGAVGPGTGGAGAVGPGTGGVGAVGPGTGGKGGTGLGTGGSGVAATGGRAPMLHNTGGGGCGCRVGDGGASDLSAFTLAGALLVGLVVRRRRRAR
jgi:MYXO-CTERM domain-containing protein